MSSTQHRTLHQALLSEMKLDAIFRQHDDDRSGDFRPLRYRGKGKFVVLGLVTTKLGEMESKDALKRRIDEAAKYAPLVLMTVGIGLIAPPIGLNVHVVNNIARDVPMGETYKGVFPFLTWEALRVLLLFFPVLCLGLVGWLF